MRPERDQLRGDARRFGMAQANGCSDDWRWCVLLPSCYNGGEMTGESLSFADAVAYLSGRVQFGQRLNRERFEELLRRIGDPQTRYPCIHVAGTNGKGSTTTFIASVLTHADFKAGAYLSPYVFDVRERIQVGGQLISEPDFARHVAALMPHVAALEATVLGATTEFELKTAVAFCYFAEQQVDFAVVEVGIGGRLDSTNVIAPPLVAVITSIGWDHVHLLGDTLGKIAGEKAGIFKTGSDAVTAVPPGEAGDVIARIARERDVPLYTVGPDGDPAALVTFSYDAGQVRLHLPGETLPNLRLSLRGAYQAQNAATAAAALVLLRRRGIAISTNALRQGLEEARLPGRFQVAQRRVDGATLLLDGAHNEDAAQTLRDALDAEWGVEQRYTFVIGTSRSHTPDAVLATLAPRARRIVATAPPFRPTPAQDVARAAEALGLAVTVEDAASEAIAQTWSGVKAGEIVIVTGSLYVVGATPAYLRE